MSQKPKSPPNRASSKPSQSPADEILESLLKEVGTEHAYSLDEESLGSATEALKKKNKKQDQDHDEEDSEVAVLGTQVHKDDGKETVFGLVTTHDFNGAESSDVESSLAETDSDPVGISLDLLDKKKFTDSPLELQDVKTSVLSEKDLESTQVGFGFGQDPSKKPKPAEETLIDLFPDRPVQSASDEPHPILKNLRPEDLLNHEPSLVQQEVGPPSQEAPSTDELSLQLDAPPPPELVSEDNKRPSLFDAGPAEIYEVKAVPKVRHTDQLLPDEALSGNTNLRNAPDIFSDATQSLQSSESEKTKNSIYKNVNLSENTIAVTGFHVKSAESLDDKVKVAIGSSGRSGQFSSWGGSAEMNLGQAENLKMAQEKILELERENEKLRIQNEELMSASEIIKERSDLLSAQLAELKNDRDGLEDSFKNEMIVLKNHLNRKDTELHKAQFKIEELESRLKFDMKKIRIRERELENRLELLRAEKNALVRNKDEQILDLRRKIDLIQMEVESYRQKCIDLNKQIESSQESFKRTTRALRLAMANLELQEEKKIPLKKVD